MKKNEKSKKATTKKTVSVSKAAKKPAKTTAKITTKITTKTTKAPVKTVSKAVKTPVSKKAAPVKAPAKAVATKAVPAKKAVKVATPTKKVAKITSPAPVKKAAVKAAPAKKAEIKATKVAAPAKTSKKAAVKTTTKTTAQAPTPSNNKSPIFVKSPLNQNMPTVSTGTAKPVISIAPQKASATPATGTTARPVYRPIQVINKPLAPLQPTRQMAPIEKEEEKVEFKKGDYVCYPAHGVGEIEAVETQIIGGMEIKLYAIAFEKDRMRLKVPVAKAHASGLRRLSSAGRMEDALKTLQGRAHVRRAMWSRRAQEYETKINSGDPVSIAEVLRDLKRSNDETEQSYSERQIYQSALERLAREVAAVEKISEADAAERLENMIKGRKARAAAEKTEKKEQAA